MTSRDMAAAGYALAVALLLGAAGGLCAAPASAVEDAAEDAFACASVALETLRLHDAACASTLASATGISLGRLYAGGYNPCSSAGSRPRRPRTA